MGPLGREPVAETTPRRVLTRPRDTDVLGRRPPPLRGHETTVRSVSGDGVTLAWDSVSTNTVELSEGTNATLNGQTRLVHFPDESSVQLSRNFQAYQEDLEAQAYFEERMNGLFSASVSAFIAVIVLLGAAYLPVKD